jgi:prepilin-type N-terminal cleavage/methylation domain-containing protein
MRRPSGFTLVELVVALTLTAVVIGFSSMFITAPLNLYETQARRAEVASIAASAWPQMREEIRTALPNSARTRRNGSVVVLELLTVVDWVHYRTLPGASFTTWGNFRGINTPFTSTAHYLAVNNLGTGSGGANAYALSGAMTPAGSTISIIATSVPGEQVLAITPAAAFTADSPRRAAFLVSGPVTFLCDESAGTLRRYGNYSISANQSARDTGGELLAAGATVRLLAQGISSCNFSVSAGNTFSNQVITAHIAAARNGETITLAEQARMEYLP